MTTFRCRWFGHKWAVAGRVRYQRAWRPVGWICVRPACNLVLAGSTRPDRRTP